MPNHIHFLVFLNENIDLNVAISEGKRFLAYEIVKRLKQQSEFSLLKVLEEGVFANEKKKGKKHQVFRLSFDAKECEGNKEIENVLDYIHHNPVSGKWNLVGDFVDYPYSSASFYELEKQNEVEVEDYRTVFSESLSGDSEG